jgi:hypothetical protein
MRTQEQFLTLIRSAIFFGNLGNGASTNEIVALSSLAPWGDDVNSSEEDERIADEMSWLPTTRDQKDPFYPKRVNSESAKPENLEAAKSYGMDVCKAILAKLSEVDLLLLKAGANNFEEAAKGAAAYAFRNAAIEVALGIDGKWLEIAEIYLKGNWPCGITKKGKVVIF